MTPGELLIVSNVWIAAAYVATDQARKRLCVIWGLAFAAGALIARVV